MNEDSWDRLLKIRTSGRDDTGSDRYKYPYEPRLIQYWKGLETVERSERKTRFLIMAVEKGVWISFCPIRPGVIL